MLLRDLHQFDARLGHQAVERVQGVLSVLHLAILDLIREELDRFILDISINNSNANAALAAVQPILSLVNTFSTFRTQGQTAVQAPVDMADYSWSASNTVALNATWNIFDGGRARAQYRLNKQRAEESTYNFASERDKIRQEVEDSFFDLRTANQNIHTTTREVLSARESLRLARLRFQAGVTTARTAMVRLIVRVVPSDMGMKREGQASQPRAQGSTRIHGGFPIAA